MGKVYFKKFLFLFLAAFLLDPSGSKIYADYYDAELNVGMSGEFDFHDNYNEELLYKEYMKSKSR